ncbi:MAG: hypothetical protein MI867_29550 [Pseudomonadales bacterium]|nr:hypothetical protein [Pseudomonadales bacterium]
MSKAIAKYQRYSAITEGFATALEQLASRAPYKNAIVIPAFNESMAFIERFSKLSQSQPASINTKPARSLLIVVANAPQNCAPCAKKTTQDMINRINERWTKQMVTKGVTFGQLNLQLDILLLDLTQGATQALKPNQFQDGVGFARKAGMDTAFELWCKGNISSGWFYSSDADAFWPVNYLNTDQLTLGKKGAAVFCFQHQQSEKQVHLSDAAARYDISLRYYVLGLRWAGSPWAYHTVGSTLVIHGESYAETRGFPNREAGEDFYLLNKIAKTAPIHCPPEPCLGLSDRPSDRVPFGTGPAVNSIELQDNPDQDFKLYHPEIFSLLRQWHQCIDQLFEKTLEDALSQSTQPASNTNNLKAAQLIEALRAIGIAKALLHARDHSKTSQQFCQHLLQWFDGFRTLKLIHWLRDHYYPSIAYQTWKNQLLENQIPFLASPQDDQDSAEALSEHLKQLEQQTLPFIGGLN